MSDNPRKRKTPELYYLEGEWGWAIRAGAGTYGPFAEKWEAEDARDLLAKRGDSEGTKVPKSRSRVVELVTTRPNPAAAKGARPNPAAPAAALERYAEFHGRAAAKATKVNVPDFDGVLVLLGRGVAIEYKARKQDGRVSTYRHKFGPGVQVATDVEGKALLVFGGRLKVRDWIYH